MVIREMNLSDFEKIKEKIKTDYDEFWNANILEQELKNEYSKYFCAIDNNSIVGFAGVWKSIDVMHITNIVVRKDIRNKGIGGLLLEKLISYSKRQDANSITLEVHEDNKIAQKLYKKYNFEEVGVRKKYYKEKNAIILTLLLKTGKVNYNKCSGKHYLPEKPN